MSIRGSVDIMTTKGAAGWAYEPGRKGGVMVQAVLSHEIVGDALATDHRSDLAAVGLGDGNCGFKIRFYREIDPLYLPFVSIKVDGGDIELPRASQAGFAEFFTALHRLHPVAGRSRSVLGGLWTDRTDAAALLKDKTDIGQIGSDAAATIAQLIHGGIAIIPLPGELSPRRDEGEIRADQVGSVIENPLLLSVLRAVFDGNPLALKVDTVVESTIPFVQPSAENGLPSPAECLAVVAPLSSDGEVGVEIVRDSHLLPEFTSSGVSRWARAEFLAGAEIAAAHHGLLTHYPVIAGTAAIVGAGTLCRLRCANGAEALKILCVPARTLPMTLAQAGEVTRNSGTRLWLR